MKKTINNSQGLSNWSQRLNPDDPSTPWNEMLETCNVTAACTAIETAGYDLSKLNRGLHTRPPMDLLFFMRKSQMCLALYHSLDPVSAGLWDKLQRGVILTDIEAQGIVPMNEYMGVLAQAVKEYVGNTSVAFVQSAPRSLVYRNLEAGAGMVIHGTYTFLRKDGSTVKSGHYQSLAGYEYDDSDPTNIVYLDWIVDDPFGDPTTNYASTVGNDVRLQMSVVDLLVKPAGNAGKDIIFIPKRAV